MTGQNQVSWGETAVAACESASAPELTTAVLTLTPQQHRIFQILSEGLSNKEVARRLGVHESTVKAHISALLAKLGCHNRTRLALLSLRYHLRGRCPICSSLGD